MSESPTGLCRRFAERQFEKPERRYYWRAFQRMCVVGTYGACFTAIARTLPDHIWKMSTSPNWGRACDWLLRYDYLVWLMLYFLVSATQNERENTKADEEYLKAFAKYNKAVAEHTQAEEKVRTCKPDEKAASEGAAETAKKAVEQAKNDRVENIAPKLKDIAFDLLQSIGALTAAVFLGYMVAGIPGKGPEGRSLAYLVANLAIWIIALFSWLMFSHPESSLCYKLKLLAGVFLKLGVHGWLWPRTGDVDSTRKRAFAVSSLSIGLIVFSHCASMPDWFLYVSCAVCSFLLYVQMCTYWKIRAEES